MKNWQYLKSTSIWQFPNLVVSNLVVCTLYAETLFCALLRSFADLRLRSFALICALLRAFACFCERPRLEPFWELQIMGHTPSTAGTFRKNFRKNSGKTPETLSERFLEFPPRVRLGCPKPYNSRHLRLPEHFQNSLPPSTAGDASFFQKWFWRAPLRAGQGIPGSTEGISEINSSSILPDLCSAGNLEPRFRNHGLQTLGLVRNRYEVPSGIEMFKRD